MEAIWRAWEYLRLEAALGISTWWLNHADPHMRVLMDKEGSFNRLLGEEMAASAYRAPVSGVDGFDGAGAADDPPNFGIVVQERHELASGVLPQPGDRGYCRAPSGREVHQPLLGRGLGRRRAAGRRSRVEPETDLVGTRRETPSLLSAGNVLDGPTGHPALILNGDHLLTVVDEGGRIAGFIPLCIA